MAEGDETASREQLRAALAELEARGARAYDAPACDCVDTLLARAEQLGGGVARRLVARAEAHLAALSARFAADGARVAASLEAHEASAGEQPELQSWLARGELGRVARRVRRLRARPAPRAATNLASPGSRAEEAGASTQPHSFASARPTRLGLRKKRVPAYEDSVAQMVATLALARAPSVVPEDAGVYNPLRIASDVLERMRAVSPFYLSVQLNRLEELASLLDLPELPPSEPPAGRLLQQADAERKQKKTRSKRGS